MAHLVLLQVPFDLAVLEGQAEWSDVPEVVRNSFLLMAKELRRLHQLLAGTRRPPQRRDLIRTDELQTQLSQLKLQVQHAQHQADARHSRTKQKLSSLWGQVAATAKAAADAQAETTDRIAASWTAAEFQLGILRTRMEEQDRRLHRNKRTRIKFRQVDQPLHELQKSQELCSQELGRLQRIVRTQNHSVVGTTMQASHQQDAEVRAAEHLTEKPKEGRLKKHDGVMHVLLHQRYVEALKRQQQQERHGLSKATENVVSARIRGDE